MTGRAVSFAEQYTTDDKSGWGDGPWQAEPDKTVWVDEATGLDCMIVRNRAGALCGYVGVPEGHPFYGKGYDEVRADVHGGLTYANLCQPREDPAMGICHLSQGGRPDHVWWLGFDCNHAFDFAPRYEADNEQRAQVAEAEGDLKTARIWRGVASHSAYRDFPYVIGEIEGLARQLKDADPHPLGRLDYGGTD